MVKAVDFEKNYKNVKVERKVQSGKLRCLSAALVVMSSWAIVRKRKLFVTTCSA